METLSGGEVLFKRFKDFCKINEQFAISFNLIEKRQLTRDQKNSLHFHYVARSLIFIPLYLQDVLSHFSEFLPKILSIAIVYNDFDFKQHRRNSVLLGKIVRTRPDLQWYISRYFENHPSPFIDEDTNQAKKIKMSETLSPDLELVESCYSLLKSNPSLYKTRWDWSEFTKYLNHKTDEVKWIACHCVAIVAQMSESELKQLLSLKITQENIEKFSCIYHHHNSLMESPACVELEQQPNVIVTTDSLTEVVEICGVFVPKLQTAADFKDSLVKVDSTCHNLKKVAFGVAAHKAVCLQGPVGCGKTSFVEYVAQKTGHVLGKNFIKVQLSDQTDSKMLLGTYRCTDVPGEFVWQPGVLTQAVVEGYWLLLEDIDLASMDIASLLSSLLENGNLTVSGYRNSVPVTPGFQLFLTHRLVTTVTGHHKKHSNSLTLLEKHLLQINVDPLTPTELKTVVVSKYPKFSTIADRMISVFQIFSKTSEVQNLPKTSRLISTRDFFKWCSRASQDFDVSSQTSALKVLQDAIDVFSGSFPNPEDALSVAREISTHLGIINQKAEYFLRSYKPQIRLTPDHLEVGRAHLVRTNEVLCLRQNYFFTRPSAVLLERIMCCVNLKEPVLLVGETGTGKTSAVQFLANSLNQKFVVINMNQQSDSADLLGGFKPVDLKIIVKPIKIEFVNLFSEYFKVEPNRKFLGHVDFCYNEHRFSDMVQLMMKSYKAALNRLTRSDAPKKELLPKWRMLGQKLEKLNLQLKQKSALAFTFVEGSLVKAVEQGYWVLLDEINLANAETLECLSGLLEGVEGSLCLLERGDKEPVRRHPNFTLFACMNPSTDIGKKDLPPGLRNRFTEIFVDELVERNDLFLLVGSYLEAFSMKEAELGKIVDFYLRVRKEAEVSLTDGSGHKPHFSLRSLCRALMIASKNPCGNVKKSLYEAFCLSFLTQLDSTSYGGVEKMIARHIIGDEKVLKAVLKQPIPQPKEDAQDYLQVEGYWVRKGGLACDPPEDYILTSSVRSNLKDLVRIVSIGALPVLLQGDTSVGKTSLISYLAKSSGNKCVRINNHEHTDLQEYIGSYVANPEGKLVFREGLLVEAMRQGHWIILDELNLAPTDVLEALNRVLDDNRELFIPETQETVKAHPKFMLFATQNPPGSYGGRKMLSRAFRNRFVELHFNEIPPVELEFILHKRCQMAPSYAKKMISVMTDLQMRRRGSAAFAGKKGFITLRDLFRWGERYRLAQNTDKLYDWDQHLSDEGYLVLAGRVRKEEEKKEIIQVLQKHLKREVIPDRLFTLSENTSVVTKSILQDIYDSRHKYQHIVWTYNMRQLAVLVAKAFQFKEPVLLVGETGGGKTSVCQVIANLNQQELLSVNCHMHTESSDFIGGLRPVRDHVENDKLFEWVDGPLIQAMLKGSVFLADEISLADDSVLERLNSLLEPERTLLLAEKGTDINNATSELIVANPGFYFIGTMNPGGDFGKKELSPALRNRFTEIWCESCTQRDDLIAIIEHSIKDGVSFSNQQDGSSGIGKSVMDFVDWFKKSEIGKRCTVSIRDILTWVNFINSCVDKIGVYEAYFHGAHLTFLDGLGSGITGTENSKCLSKFRAECVSFIENQLRPVTQNIDFVTKTPKIEHVDNLVGIKPFYIPIGDEVFSDSGFTFDAPTTAYNALRLLRGMQLNKAILLEGSPGVGKTSLVTALAKIARHKIFRVNLSDQTDISDLFGADLPVEGGLGGQFSWRDGPLLQALKQGHWILLDELNLASQSVLEGLNACLDHRGEIFIPELGKTFYVKPGTRFFGCQNPLKQGGSRRGLPQSFLNRFIQVHVSLLTHHDLNLILTKQFPNLDPQILSKMLLFNSRLQNQLENHVFGHRGSPWELNLRDLTRWCEATIYHFHTNPEKKYHPENLVQLIYADRMRTLPDKAKIGEIFEKVFGRGISGDAPTFHINKDTVFIGDVSLKRNWKGVDADAINEEKNCLVLRSQLQVLRSLAYCVNLNWMSLLVGSSGVGKSTVVRVLANILGKTLRTLPVTSAMDTTDILGGFEQTDYSRHLEEIARQTERLLLEIVRSKLVKDRPCEDLLRLWKGYSDLDVVQAATMHEETDRFLLRLDQLERIWTIMESEKDPEKTALHALRSRGEKMRALVKNEGALNAGGKFEWVDSVLIKCLHEGSWLLVDNVNLCSAAVLDRLNALLEPKGVLTVSERGVDSDGRMVEITPHPDFRLFLTMDPKNGEISRAMRNRGIEICLLEKGNSLDVKSLVRARGLDNSAYIASLINLHDFVSDLILGEKPTINELLRSSALISQQLQHGVNPVEAFHATLMEVYYKTKSAMEFNCNDFGSVIRAEIAKTLTEKQAEETFSGKVTLQTLPLHSCSDLEKIKQQAALLQDGTSDLARYLLIHFYSLSSKSDLRLRFRYLSDLLKGEVSLLSKAMFEFLQKQQLGSDPIDGRWIPTGYSGNESNSNKIVLALHVITNLEHEQLQIEGTNKSSLLKYMSQRRINMVDDKFDEILIDELLNLMENFDKFLKDAIQSSVNLEDDDVIKIVYLLTWRFLFYRCTFAELKKVNAKEKYLLVTKLKIHYHWFLKYSLKMVADILKAEPPNQLNNIVKTIDSSLEKQFSRLHKFSRKFQKANNNPAPKTSKLEIEFSSLFQKVGRMPQDFETRTKLINLRLDETDLDLKIKELKTLLEGEVSLSVKDTELLPFVEHLTQLHMKRFIFSGNVEDVEVCKNCLSLPVDLVTSMALYQKSGDDRLLHDLTRAYFSYLMNAGTLAPKLTHYLTGMLVSATNASVTKFGNYRELTHQHRLLNLSIWRNIRQLNSPAFDFLQTEREYVQLSFRHLIRKLGELLGVDSESFTESVDGCLQKLSSLQDSGLGGSFLKHLSNCARNYAKLDGDSGDLFVVFTMHMELSYAKAVLNSRLALIDPSAKKALKKRYCTEAISSLDDLRDSFRRCNEVYGDSDKSLHSHYQPVVEMVKKLREKNVELGSYVATRPKDLLYQDVVKMVNHGFSTLFSCHRVDSIIENLDTSINALLKNDPFNKQNLTQHESSLTSFMNLLEEWSKCTSYPDVMDALLSNASEFVYGFKNNLAVLRQLLVRQEFGNLQELSNLVRVPNLNQSLNSYEKVVDWYAGPSELIDRALAGSELLGREKLRLLKCAVQETYNGCLIESAYKPVDFTNFANFVKAFVEAYNGQEREREQLEREADSLYKTRTKCADPTEEEQIASELKELFPNYHDTDFADIQDANLESISQPRETLGVISEEDLKFVADLHLTLVQNFTRTEWLNPKKNASTPDFVHPLVEKFHVFKVVSEKVLAGLDYSMDKELIESISVLLTFVQKYGDVNYLVEHSSPSRVLGKKADFYKDSNVEEAKASFHILQELKLRVHELINEWPDHPTLNSIATIIERIYNFDITSPLSRFLTGFEILLSKCHEWEEVAHSGVSLSQHSQNLTHQIISWRKMELSVWKDLLNSTFTRMNAPMYKWWLYLYNMMEQFVVEGKFADIELIEALQNYMTRSNLAEFQSRLDLLHAFHCHAVHLERTEKSEIFICVLWNVYNYFGQFSGPVANRVRDLRAPIEKKLKDYVKIVRWKDVNYWAIKETVDKSHKTLHKYVREFQDVLREPVLAYLVNNNAAPQETVGIWDRPQRAAVKTYHYSLDPQAYVAKEKSKLPSKIESYFTEVRKLCKDSISAMKYPKMIRTLDNFVTQIIETSTHLQRLEVDTSLAKEKQKAQAKSVLNQKHRALADLFKALANIGLSFRTGIVEARLKLATAEFLVHPIDIGASFSHINYNRKDEKILTIWESCESYYLKSLMRADVLDTALKSPAPDLGQQNVDRCRGFASHLLTLTHQHKSRLIQSSNQFYFLRHYTTQINRLCEGEEFLEVALVQKMQTILKNVNIVLNQVKIFLNTCPEEEFVEVCEVIVLKPEPQNFIQFKNDHLWNKTSALIGETLASSIKICQELEKSKGDIPNTDHETIHFDFVPIDLDVIRTKFEQVRDNLTLVASIFGDIETSKSLLWLSSEIDNALSDLSTGHDQFDSGRSMKNLKATIDKLSDEISRVIHALYKKYANEPLLVEDEETSIENDHLKLLIIENLDNDFKELNVERILNLCQTVARILFKVPPQHLQEHKSLSSSVLPLLEQVILYHQYFLTQQVSAYRIICKMSSILLNIFIDLASKGFCVPPELTEEEEGIGKPSDGLGLGEGQGQKDVSDRIESEDQLDDARQAGQEEEKNEDPDCREEEKGIEMSEDFDSKLQDVAREEEDEEQSEDSEGEEQMGETGKDGNKQDKETFGDEDQEQEESEDKEESGEGGQKDGEQQLGAKEKEKNSGEEDASAEKEEKQKEINEMKEPEFDDEQTDPYHGNQPELPEPEPMDLPDDLQLDEGQEDEVEDKTEENPFDIDTMKEDNPFEKKTEDTEDKEDKENEYSSEDEEIRQTQENDGDEDEGNKKEKEETRRVSEDEDEDEDNAESAESGLDQKQTNEDRVEAMETEDAEATDKTTPNQAQNQESSQPNEETCQEDKPDKEGVGHSQMEESTSGHSAQTSAQELQSSKRQREEEAKKKQKPGESDAQRSLGDVNEPVKKKLKTVDTENEDEGQEPEESEEAEMYKHIKEAKEKETQVLDVATKEQAESQKYDLPEDKGEEMEEAGEVLPESEDNEDLDVKSQKPEKVESEKKKKGAKQHPEGEVEVEEMQEVDIEGEVIETIGVQRGADTSYHTLYEELREVSMVRLTQEEVSSMRHEVETQLSSWDEPPTDAEADRAWQKISSMMSSLAQDLSEQLRLVLEPTQSSRLKGDYRTGRRINMRKVIPYIASQFRKDKIWLRRTKPSKRDYQIVLAIDDSSSMADNHSKELAFESVALISKALSLLESGQLSVLSFGENTQILHKLTDQFTDRSGVKLLQKFKFDQSKTCVAKLVDFVTQMFEFSHSHSQAMNAKLLVIVSDGRGVFSEGEGFVRQAVRRARLANIFMVFVIVDNPENKNSILDVRMPVFKDGKLLGIHSYMDVFPFSFYIILRDINSLPNVLSDALRQWFEVVSNLDKQ